MNVFSLRLQQYLLKEVFPTCHIMTIFFKAQRLPASFIDQIYLGNDQLILRKVLVIIGEELSSGFYSLFGVQTGISTMLNL